MVKRVQYINVENVYTFFSIFSFTFADRGEVVVKES